MASIHAGAASPIPENMAALYTPWMPLVLSEYPINAPMQHTNTARFCDR